MTFRDREKERYRSLKPKLFSPAAQQDGIYRGRSRFFCLADDCASENLYRTIRSPAIAYFECRGIPWHDGLNNRRIPSNHLCCSQSCCVNFLYPMTSKPMTSKPNLVASVFRNFYPEMLEALPIYKDLCLSDNSYPYIAFEWIGTQDYLGEQKRKRVARTRGANFTSADFAFRFKRLDGKIQLVLGEWKYTEYYNSMDLGIEVRKQNYSPSFNREGGIFAGKGTELYDALFFEPFYQLMRLQLLAQEMELFQEMDADIVSVLHVCPSRVLKKSIGLADTGGTMW